MRNRRFSKFLPVCVIGLGLTACSQPIGETFANLDFDLRDAGGGLDTSEAARQATVARPEPDSRGVISYPTYQVAVARRGDNVNDLATRVGGDPVEIARLNGLQLNDALNNGEVVALPASTPVPVVMTDGAGARAPLDVGRIATTALDRAPQSNSRIAQATPSRRIDGPEPIQHQVARGETAYSIARLYNISPRALSDWNGLGPDLEVREGQFLLIPVTSTTEVATQVAAAPAVVNPAPASGTPTPTPTPPSAKKPLPDEDVKPIKAAPAAASKATGLLTPTEGDVLRGYKKGTNDGIDIAAPAGTPVKAAADGTVAAITRDTDQVPIMVLRHANDLLTVYANIDGITVNKGDRVTRGQTVATVKEGRPSFLHFEVREQFESVDPAKYLK
ncbi:M23 family metallopeptidase [Litoreibacter roseus]|uniref:Peptidase M23 n=1 Tax=Litoreibacter roseus TaxID=2601869 RepID=A0A6N6JKA4_9RHOB|nr:M23 family metallopeptidase [Litoreibacter roseus]GFE65859.1 peptidase M23 [Litoreibacter roseus]